MRRALLALLVLCGTGQACAADAGLSVQLKPAAPDEHGQIAFVDVALEIDRVHADTGADPDGDGAILKLPILQSTVPTGADRMEDLRVADDEGSLAVDARDVVHDPSNSTRFWRPARAVSGPLRIRYRVFVDTEVPGLVAPQYELRTTAGVVSGSATSFLLLPLDEARRRVSVRWDLSAFEADAIGVSSFGVGDTDTTAAYRPDEIASTYVMAGRAGLFQDPPGRFFAAWQGTPAFEAEALMEWANGLQTFYGEFFDQAPDRFGIFGRLNPANPGSGIGLTHSFAFTFGEDSPMESLQGLLAHEMLHAWVRGFDGHADGASALAGSWFSEGLAVHYQRLLPFRAGLTSSEAFLDSLNSTAGRYYTNVKMHVPNSEIPAGFWRDTRIRVLPYDRGSLYFAKLDADIRSASNGERSLDDIVRELLAARSAGETVDEALWREKLRSALGDRGVAEFDAMLVGETVLPPSDAFGPCFRRTTRPLRRYNLGFDPEALLDRPRIVRGLDPESNAAKAGLRNGEVIQHSFPQDSLQGDQDGWLELDVLRDGEARTIRYQPRGETVEAYQWEVVPTASGCPEGG